ncbi:MAG: alpha-E domain-containing protein [Verrucomicrobia bacterium]|nr:MAG: alpha-E domain-containing protein [Verrucomicrobiota bacterium]
MLSRVANLIYWIARQLERAENTARIVEVNAQLVLDLQSRQAADDPRAWEPLVFVTGSDEKFHELYGEKVTERAVIEFMLFDKRNASSVLSCVSFARENARCIRDQLTAELWETINTFYLRLKDDDFTRYAQLGSADYLAWIKTQTQLFHGVADAMFPRTNAWWFYDLGRHLERADNTTRILDIKYYMILPSARAVGSALDMVQWASVLRSCSAFEAFRRTRRGDLDLLRVVDYLLRDPDFPRSVRYSVATAEQCLLRIGPGDSQPAVATVHELFAALHKDLRTADAKAIIAEGLHEYLDGIQKRLERIHGAIQAAYIDYGPSEVGQAVTQAQA